LLAIARGAAGAAGTRSSLRPFLGKGQWIGITRATASRGNENACLGLFEGWSDGVCHARLRYGSYAGSLRRCAGESGVWPRQAKPRRLVPWPESKRTTKQLINRNCYAGKNLEYQ